MSKTDVPAEMCSAEEIECFRSPWVKVPRLWSIFLDPIQSTNRYLDRIFTTIAQFTRELKALVSNSI